MRSLLRFSPTAPLFGALFGALLLAAGVVGAGMLLAGCSGPQTTTTDDDTTTQPSTPGPDQPDPAPSPTGRALAQAETFDASQYPLRTPTRSASVQHAVPDRLMRLRADEGATQTVEGFRVQVFSATNKQSAEQFRVEVQSWLQGARDDAPDGLFSSNEAPVVIQYSQPYYRVRIGAFTKRDQARKALDFVRMQYSDAFITRSTVTVTR